ncbi:MAG: trigger factor [Acidimicrobiia bacterium]
METSVETLEDHKVRLRVDVPADEFEKAMDLAFRKLAREVRIPGFRPGKAPRRILEARIGTEIAREEALRSSLPEYYTEAVAAEAIDPIGQPEFDITAGVESGDVSFDAVVEVRPVPDLANYKGIQVTVPDPKVTDEEVEEQLRALRERFADLEDSSAPLSAGDVAQLNVKGYVHDEEVEGLSATDFLYEVGSEMVTPKLDGELTGKRPGEIVRFNDILPARWGERAGEEVSFQVLVKETKRKVLPEADDDWAKEASEFDTIAELRDGIRRRMAVNKLIQSQLVLQERLFEALADMVTVDAPAVLVRKELERRLHNVLHRLEEQGATVEQYLAATGQTQQQLVERMEGEAARAVKADLALRAVVAREGIEASDEEVDDEIARLAERSGQKKNPAQLKKQIERATGLEAVRSELSRGKALQFLVDQALVYDEAGHALDLTDAEEESQT